MVSWFNFYRKFKDLKVNRETYFDKELYNRSIEEEQYLEENKGKFIPFIDDITGEYLTENEIKEMEQYKEQLRLPNVKTPKDDSMIAIRGKRDYTNNNAKKQRDVISELKRKQVKKRDNYECQVCGNKKADQIHHINKDPSDSRLVNLILLCYECHRKIHKKIKDG